MALRQHLKPSDSHSTGMACSKEQAIPSSGDPVFRISQERLTLMDADKNIAVLGRAQELYRQGREAMERDAYDVAVAALAESARLEPHFKTLELLG